ncbi:hypothetical protein [Ktedonospora formicarum]|uniref:Uncharacterized protein n=1 Tax=Ktedonospora formicarum TaxID=2778364 RepID=A0A8J3HX43_9CHLR|nr:hypothetical protein [Ktedonospora formicarum]GHO45722.1 hypothetical protein KSX_38850 [Ktedonospora formicarum]
MFGMDARKRSIARISLFFAVCGLLGFALTFVSTPTARAASHSGVCIERTLASNKVYDSYGHLQGVLILANNTCGDETLAQFQGNTNTWKTIDVYVEYTNKYGYLHNGYGYSPNIIANSPSYFGYDCYYAEIALVDNKGNWNWYGTSNACA